jgi:hypothetical protein
VFVWDINVEQAREVSCSLWKSVCNDWIPTVATQLYASLWKYLSSYSKLVGLCVWILFMWYQKRKASCSVVLGMKELSNLLQRCWVWEAGPIPWPWRSCEFNLLDNIFWDYVTEHICIGPFGILLMEMHTEIEHVFRLALFLDYVQQKVVIPLRCFGITNRSHLQGSRCPEKHLLVAGSLHILDVF